MKETTCSARRRSPPCGLRPRGLQSHPLPRGLAGGVRNPPGGITSQSRPGAQTRSRPCSAGRVCRPPRDAPECPGILPGWDSTLRLLRFGYPRLMLVPCPLPERQVPAFRHDSTVMPPHATPSHRLPRSARPPLLDGNVPGVDGVGRHPVRADPGVIGANRGRHEADSSRSRMASRQAAARCFITSQSSIRYLSKP
jgi:hypothetical protein